MAENFRLGVGIVLLNPLGKVFVAQRLDSSAPAWQMPQGGIEKGEAPQAAAARELLEEIGTDKFYILRESTGWYEYRLPDEIAVKIWGGKYTGQRQKWMLGRFTGQDSDINIQTAHPEFSNWRWAEPQQVPELIVDFKKEMYKKIMADFQQDISSAQN